MPAVVIKVSYQGEIRRSRIDKEDFGYDDVVNAIVDVLPDVKDYTAKYIDDEGDACTLCRASFQDFLEMSKSVSKSLLVLKLDLSDAAKPEPSKQAEFPRNLEQQVMNHVFKSLGANANCEVLHHGVTCDGCNVSPIAGVRFKCTNCPDYDLCGACFANRDSVHCGEFAKHEFARIETSMNDFFHCPADPVSMVLQMATQGMEGWCKSKGKGKGTGAMCQNQPPRPCATPGCSFQATWHPTHCCKGCARHGGECHGHMCERLRADGVAETTCGNFLTPRMMASLVVAMLPKFLPHLAGLETCHGHGLQMVLAHAPQVRDVLCGMEVVLETTRGLEHCIVPLRAALQGCAESASQFVLALATGLDVLRFNDQIDFVEACFAQHWAKLQDLLSRVPFLVECMHHRGVTCDGCQQAPIMGPRFKCKNCNDFDLCGECFSKKTAINEGRCADHEFDCIITNARDSIHPGKFGRGWWRKGMWGKGTCGKGKCKGNGKGLLGKGWWGKGTRCTSPHAEETTLPHEVATDGAGAPDQAQNKSGSDHVEEMRGVEMEKVSQDSPSANEKDVDEDVQKEQCTLEVADMPELPGPTRFAIPVTLDDGRELLMDWEAGSDLQEVAAAWVAGHGLPEEFVPQLVDAARQLSK